MGDLATAEKLLKSAIPNYLEMEHEHEFANADGAFMANPREVAKPYFINVSTTHLLINTFYAVYLFNAATSLMAANFGNSSNIVVTNNYPNQTYGGLLSSTIDEPFKLKKMRVESIGTVFDLPDNLAFTETQYIGEAATKNVNLTIYLDQYYQSAIEFETDELITSTKQIYLLIADDASINLKMFPEYIFTVGNKLKRAPMLTEKRQQNTMILPQKTWVSSHGKSH